MKKKIILQKSHKLMQADKMGFEISHMIDSTISNGEKLNLSFLQLWSEIAEFETRESKICENHQCELLLKDLKRYAELVNEARFSARCEAYFRLQELVLNV